MLTHRANTKYELGVLIICRVDSVPKPLNHEEEAIVFICSDSSRACLNYDIIRDILLQANLGHYRLGGGKSSTTNCRCHSIWLLT